jgi:hypothetical protein
MDAALCVLAGGPAVANVSACGSEVRSARRGGYMEELTAEATDFCERVFADGGRARRPGGAASFTTCVAGSSPKISPICPRRPVRIGRRSFRP